jgi:hypothetical protein
MNKSSAKKKRLTKGSPKANGRAPARKEATRVSARTAAATRQAARKSEPISAVKAAAVEVATVTVAQITALAPVSRHRFRVGQTVFYTSSPISRPGASGSYKVVRLLPSDGDDYQYRIKNPGEAFERVAKESQLELEH